MDDDDEAEDEATWDDARTMRTAVVTVTCDVARWRREDGEACERLRAWTEACAWTPRRAMSVAACVGTGGDAEKTVVLDVVVRWRCRGCVTEEGRLERRLTRRVEAFGGGGDEREMRGDIVRVREFTVSVTAPGYVPIGSFEETVVECGPDGPGVAEAAARFHEDGVATCLRIVDDDCALAIRHLVLEYIEKIERRFAEGHPDIAYGKDRFAFKEISSRGGERFDALIDIERPEWKSLRDLARIDAPWLAFINEVLSTKWNVNVSVVYSRPGAKNQEWHADGRHLDTECDPRTGEGHAQPYGVCVFMPLIHLDRDTGYTQFFKRSHKTSELIGFGEAASMLRLSFDGLLNTGQSVVYDYRLLHRGMYNRSNYVRPVLQFLYTAPAYRETKNYGVDSMW